MIQAITEKKVKQGDLKQTVLSYFIDSDKASYGEMQKVLLYQQMLELDNGFADELLDATRIELDSRNPDNPEEEYIDGLIDGLDLFKQMEEFKSLKNNLTAFQMREMRRVKTE